MKIWIFEWLMFCINFYWPQLLGIQALYVAWDFMDIKGDYGLSGLSLSLFVGFCFWVFWCYVVQGRAVG